MCLSVFDVFCGTILRKWKEDKTFLLRLSKKLQRFVGDNKGLPERTKLHQKHQTVLGNDNGLYCRELAK
jgi:hypothetical protein